MPPNEKLTVTPHKTLLTTTNPFEQKFGYHRAVRRGPFIAVSGTTALRLLSSSSDPTDSSTSEPTSESASKVYFPGDAHGQAVHVLQTCLAAVTRLGGKKEDVIRVKMFVADGKDCGVVGDAYREVFGTLDGGDACGSGQEDVVGAAATMIVVPGGFVDGDILVEIEVDAFVV